MMNERPAQLKHVVEPMDAQPGRVDAWRAQAAGEKAKVELARDYCVSRQLFPGSKENNG